MDGYRGMAWRGMSLRRSMLDDIYGTAYVAFYYHHHHHRRYHHYYFTPPPALLRLS